MRTSCAIDFAIFESPQVRNAENKEHHISQTEDLSFPSSSGLPCDSLDQPSQQLSPQAQPTPTLLPWFVPSSLFYFPLDLFLKNLGIVQVNLVRVIPPLLKRAGHMVSLEGSARKLPSEQLVWNDAIRQSLALSGAL